MWAVISMLPGVPIFKGSNKEDLHKLIPRKIREYSCHEDIDVYEKISEESQFSILKKIMIFLGVGEGWGVGDLLSISETVKKNTLS